MKLCTDSDEDGQTPENVYTISSPCEPDGSGELKMLNSFWIVYFTARSKEDVHKARFLPPIGSQNLEVKQAN